MGILSLEVARLSIKGQGVRVRLTYRKEIGAIMDKETVPVNGRTVTMRLPVRKKLYATFNSVYAPTTINPEEIK